MDGVLPAVVGGRKGLTVADLRHDRLDTAIGAVVTQLIMAAVLVAVAATLGKTGGDHALDTIEEIPARSRRSSASSAASCCSASA